MTDSTQARPTAAVVGGGVSGLTAAYLLAVQRVADATAMRGLYP